MSGRDARLAKQRKMGSWGTLPPVVWHYGVTPLPKKAVLAVVVHAKPSTRKRVL